VLRSALRRLGLRYRVDVAALPGRPDIVFGPTRVAVFCDGDFWHGRDLEQRLSKLARGHNAPYWVAKIQSNVARDRRHDEALARGGWLVLRFWETDIARNAATLAARIAEAVSSRRA
jgi:DNA mismatch endonuclease (patch repair protein)